METPSAPDSSNNPSDSESIEEALEAELYPAPFIIRMIAFLMDYAVIIAATVMLCYMVLYPHFHPGFQEASQRFIQEQQAAGDLSFQEQMKRYMDFQMEYENVGNDTAFILAVITWMYFGLSELLLKGSTLGKKVFKLSLIDLKTLNRPEGKTILLRNCLKSLSVIMPLLFIVNLAFVLFNRLRLSGHDMATKTMVTYESVLPSQTEIRQHRSF